MADVTATPPPVDRRASTPSPPTDGFTEAEKAASVLIGYTMGAVVVLPFDRVKSLMQVDEVARKHGALGLAARILRTEGVRGLYRGGGVHMMIAPYTTFYYLLYDGIQARGRALTASPASPDGHHLVPLVAAIAARSVEVSLRMPLELVRTRMQASAAQLSLADCVAALKAQPLWGWFRGLVPTLGRDVPFSALYWWSYEACTRRLSAAPALKGSTLATAFVSGALSGIFAALLVTPIDVLKTVRQHQPLGQSYASILGAIRAEPQRAFAGVLPRLVRIPAGMAAMMTGIEGTKWMLTQQRLSSAGVQSQS
mmetsp:Transcript_10711/g.35541  ORF Transcript_10711/g.35541 Transcript_10711/m.35541 type:complete len:311 (+) Transcript_10711:152-1084(+)